MELIASKSIGCNVNIELWHYNDESVEYWRLRGHDLTTNIYYTSTETHFTDYNMALKYYNKT
jgi:hypothetical protein